MRYMSQNFRLFRLTNLSVQNVFSFVHVIGVRAGRYRSGGTGSAVAPLQLIATDFAVGGGIQAPGTALASWAA